MPGDTRWPGDSDQSYPDVFTKPPPRDPNSSANVLSPEQIDSYFTRGYVVLKDILTPDDLEPVKADIEVLVENLAQKLHKAGKITKLHSDAGLFKRLTLLEKEFPGTNVLMHKGGWLPPSFRTLWSHKKLLDLAEQLLGTPDIQGHPVWNLRTKTPKNEATIVPWHQDSAYLDNSSYNVMQLTAWIPLLDTDEQNGCLQLAEGGHRTGRIATHQCCHGGTWYIMLDEHEMQQTLGTDLEKDIKTIPVPYGSILLFNNLIPHRSLPNMSDDVRYSLDLRWQRTDQPVGFYGVKDGIQLRSSDPSFSIEWDDWNNINRTVRQRTDGEEEEEFDTTISGPWMKKWEISAPNIHTDNLDKQDGGWHEINKNKP